MQPGTIENNVRKITKGIETIFWKGEDWTVIEFSS